MSSRRYFFKSIAYALISAVSELLPLQAIASASAQVNLHDWLAQNKRTFQKETLEQVLEFCAKNNSTLFIPGGDYIIDGTVHIPSGTRIQGVKGETKIRYAGETPQEIFRADNAYNISFDSLKFHGGMSPDMKEIKFYVRGVRFVSCHDISLRNCEINHCADWHLSFEKCQNIKVASCSISGDGDGRPGGRDGIHFLDSSNILIRDIEAHTGDDCVAFTVEAGTCENVVVENIRGTSKIGSVLIFNEERDAVSSFRNISIRGVTALGEVRDIVRVQAINPGTVISGVSLQDVTGTSRNHAVFLASLENVEVANLSIRSIGQNGLHCISGKGLTLSHVKSAASDVAFDAIHIQNCQHVRCFDIDSDLPEGRGISFIKNLDVKLFNPSFEKLSQIESGNGFARSASDASVPQSLRGARFIQNNGLVFVSGTLGER